MNYLFRKGVDDGSWCSFLLPFCLLANTFNSNSVAHRLLFMICMLLSISCVVKRNLYEKKSYQSYTYNLACGLFSIPMSAAVWCCTSYDVYILYLLCFGSLLLYNYLLSSLLQCCPGSFTLGEAQVIGQGIILFLLCCIPLFINEQESPLFVTNVKFSESGDFSKALLLGCLLLIYCLYVFPPLKYGWIFHLTCFTVALLMLFVWSIYHNKNPVIWLLAFCLYNNRRIAILLFWIISTIASIAFVVWVNQTSKSKASTVTRKYFHFIINAVYIPGIIYDVELLSLASAIALTVFIMLEVYRILNISIIGPIIENAFQVFLDEKDSGLLILTHIYLLVGCSCPIWLHVYDLKGKEYHICLLSGIISVGFGDSAAALCGSLIGRNYWMGSKKTFEGTACAFLTQLICSFIFLYIGHHYSTYNCFLIIISALLTSLLEAKTIQVDNLVLPLFTFSFLSWIQ